MTATNMAAVLRLTTASGIVLGTGVAVSPRMLLTASHLFCGKPPVVYAESPDGRRLAEAKALNWCSGEKHAIGDPTWPKEVETYFGEKDQFVLVDFGRSASLVAPGDVPTLSDEELAAGLELVVGGLGVDEDGNYRPVVREIPMRKVASAAGRFVRAEPLVDTGPHPGKDDSGAPMFVRAAGGALRTVAIHAGVTLEPEDSRKPRWLFLPVTTEAIEWVGKTLQGAALAAEQDSRVPFCFRNRFPCLMLAKPGDLDGTYVLPLVTKPGELLAPGDRITLKNEGAVLVIHGKDRKDVEFRLEPDTPSGTPCHWLCSVEQDPQVFVFLRGYRGGQRQVRLELYEAGTAHPKPTVRNVSYAQCGIWGGQAEWVPAPGVPFLPDKVEGNQDAEAEGYEELNR